MSNRSINLYATRTDLMAVLLEFESSYEVTYYEEESFLEIGKSLDSASQLVSLGVAQAGRQLLSGRFLVLPNSVRPCVEEVQLRKGGWARSLSLAGNPDAIQIDNGGAYCGQVLLPSFFSANTSPGPSQKRWGALVRSVKRAFDRVGSYWVGPEAGALLDAGHRLTFSVQAPEEYDLTRDSL